MISWKLNTERPNFTEHSDSSLIVYSKIRDFFGELYYSPPCLDDDGNEILGCDGLPLNPEQVNNDEGYFNIPWSEIDGWIYLSDLKEYLVPMFDSQNQTGEDMIIDGIAQAFKELPPPIQPPIDISKQTYNILFLDFGDDGCGYSKTIDGNLKLHFYPDVYPHEIARSSIVNDWVLTFRVNTEQWYNYNVNPNISLKELNKPTGYYRLSYIISNCMSQQEMIEILLKYEIQHYTNSIKDQKIQIDQHKNIIKQLKSLT